jgi:hypothetical protein
MKRTPDLDVLLSLGAACGTERVRATPDGVTKIGGLARAKKAAALWAVVRPELITWCRPTYNPPTRIAKAIAARLGIDFDAFAKQVVAEIPTPKSWRKLKPDGRPKKAASQGKAKAKGNGAKKAGGKKAKRGKRAKARKAKTPRGRGPKKRAAKAGRKRKG